MIEETLDIQTKDGSMETFIVRPERNGPHPGVHHGFAFPGRWCYDKPAAERHWERLIALYRRQLG